MRLLISTSTAWSLGKCFENFRRLSLTSNTLKIGCFCTRPYKKVMNVSAAHARWELQETEATLILTLFDQWKESPCNPLWLCAAVFYDSAKSVIALVHSGWENSSLILGAKQSGNWREPRFQCRRFDCSFGPHIRNCCFEVDRDVADAFKISFIFCAGIHEP